MTIYFITGNENKFREAKKIMPELVQLSIDLPEIQDINSENIIKEKLKEAIKHKQGEFIVEDGSFYMDCLNGLPGPLIKWFVKALGDKGIYELAKKYNNFKAEVKVTIGYARNSEDIHFFEGSIKGKIVPPTGPPKFGWDTIFVPENHEKSFGQMTLEEKNSISHRKIALEKLKEYLKKIKK